MACALCRASWAFSAAFLTRRRACPKPRRCVGGCSGWVCLRLREVLEVADDWVYLIDHSVQIGTVKVCVILGLRLRDVPFPVRALRHDDVRVLAVISIEHSTGEIVAAQMENAAERTGFPRQVVSDHGGNVKKGSELFAQRHPGTVVFEVPHSERK